MNPLFVFSGPSGSGKSTIVNEVMKKIQTLIKEEWEENMLPLGDNRIVTTTTRHPRAGEKNGLDYHFIPVNVFKEKLQNEEFAEHVEYLGNYYGTTKEELNKRLKKGPAFAIVEFEGMQKIKAFYPNTVTIFISISFDDVKKQLIQRNDPKEIREKRIAAYQNEIQNGPFYDYVVQNTFGHLEEAIASVQGIIKENLPKNA